MGIDLRSGNIAVAEQFLHRTEISAVYQQIGRELMPDLMRGNPLGDSGFPAVKFNQSLDCARSYFADNFRRFQRGSLLR